MRICIKKWGKCGKRQETEGFHERFHEFPKIPRLTKKQPCLVPDIKFHKTRLCDYQNAKDKNNHCPL